MWLRDVELGDVDAYVRMRCDPLMMAELGGPLPVAGMAAKVERDVAAAVTDRQWIKMIVVDGAGAPGAPGDPGAAAAAAAGVAGTVTLWAQEEDGAPHAEIGWMVLPEFQGRGLGRWAVGELLRLARADGRWGRVNAYPAVTNGPSNGICRSLGFTLRGERRTAFAGRSLLTNHWTVET
ncbi:GNAT family N-acetyltransferase [Kitasatospora sp. NBC_01287]|uniref:GNAT family N-acetyltransferase n=1 Tax=Kitasatospora sp. NBC_01287 TaxID=2903573 RepID=UPI002257D6A8|nr:GNAT family N-acetyltransferase [Kitasatospora sp. NBC_01287]MCX4745231.1 GNAT family N-acetyltransferase [Kitasatospora sp. NBC_01287]